MLPSVVLLLLFSSSISATHLALRRRATNTSNGSGQDTSPLTTTLFNTIFDVNITIGTQTVPVLVDTGSSDTYVMRTSYTCINGTTNAIIPQSSCLYGPTLYDPTLSPTYHAIANESFGVLYGAGIASGLMATETVTLSGLTAHNVTVGIADISTPMGDGLNVGLLGLGYPSLTSAHPGPISNTPNDTFYLNRLPYNPIIYTMRDQGLLDSPTFSIALARTPQNDSTGFGGYLSLGTLPPVQHDADFTTVPVEITSALPLNVTSGQKVRSYWTLTVSDIRYGPNTSISAPPPSSASASLPGNANANATNTSLETSTASFQAFVDTGNYISYLPGQVVSEINSLFSPPAVYDPTSELYVVDCTATPPQVGVTIGNATFFHDGRDLVYQIGGVAGSGAEEDGGGQGDSLCVSSIASADSAAFQGISIGILGVPFLKNVVSVFDIERNEMRFAKLTGEVQRGQEDDGTSSNTGNSVSNAGARSFKSQDGGHFIRVVIAVAMCVGLGGLLV